MAKIWIVDDNENVLKILEILISKLGHITELFVDPLQLLEKFKTSSSVDLIISNYNMPNLNGVELYHKIMEIDADMKFVYCTAKHNFLPSVPVIYKPFNKSDIKKILEEVL